MGITWLDKDQKDPIDLPWFHPMKICVHQYQSIRGDIAANISKHLTAIDRAAKYGCRLIIFPELSLTGYEPELAEKLAIVPEDESLESFQVQADSSGITIGVGVPTRYPEGVRISMMIFDQGQIRRMYHKQFLHPDEEPFFVPGYNPEFLLTASPRIVPAICFEISVQEHTQNAIRLNPDLYVASVAKSESGVQEARRRLRDLAKVHSIPVLMSNSVGQSGGFISAGKSSVWDENANLQGELDADSEGQIIYDTLSGIVESNTKF